MNTLDALEVVPTGAALGAEIRGVDLTAPVSDAVGQALREAWYEHLVLLFRGQHMDNDAIMRTAGIFGGSQGSGAHSYFDRNAGKFNPHPVDGYPEILAITNLDENGEPTLDNGGLGSHEVVWHSDNSYIEVPPAGSLLHAIEIPIGGGGNSISGGGAPGRRTTSSACRTTRAKRCSMRCGRTRPGPSSRGSTGGARAIRRCGTTGVRCTTVR